MSFFVSRGLNRRTSQQMANVAGSQCDVAPPPPLLGAGGGALEPDELLELDEEDDELELLDDEELEEELLLELEEDELDDELEELARVETLMTAVLAETLPRAS